MYSSYFYIVKKEITAVKHISRIVFGFSIVAVPALFTACQQPSSPKKDIGKNNGSGATTAAAIGSVEATAKTGTAGGVTLKMKDLNGDDGTYTKVKITVEKFKNGESRKTDAAKLANQAGSGNAVESIEISKADFASKHLTDTTGLHKHGNRLSRMFTAVSIEFR